MKYLQKYKKFILNESYYDVNDLEIDDVDVDNYYKNNYDFEELHKFPYVISSSILAYVDVYKLNDDEKSDFKQEQDLNEYDDYYFKKYLSYKKLDDKVNDKWEEIIEDNDEETKKDLMEMSYSERVEDMDDEQLKSIIEDDTDSFFDYVYDEKYKSGIEYLEEIYGFSFSTPNEDINEEEEKQKLNLLEKYIDWGRFDKDTVYNTDYVVKENFYKGNIPTNEKLQKQVFDYDNSNILYLFDIISEENNFTNSHSFQYTYLKEKIKNDLDLEITDIDKIEDEYDKNEIAEMLKEIDDKYNLDNEIKNQFSDYTYLIDLEKFNI